MGMLDYTITRTNQPTAAADLDKILANPGFGQHFTDHMVTIDWSTDKGWHDAQVRPYGPISLDPATNVFHYGQAIFEGLKAYRHADGSISTFRPEQNAKRMQHSAHRLAMPELPEELFIESLRQLVSIDKAWVPEAGGEAERAGLVSRVVAPDALLDEAHVTRAAAFLTWSQVEPGHICPITMTNAAVPALRHSPELAERVAAYRGGYLPEERRALGRRIADAQMAFEAISLNTSFRSTPDITQAVDAVFALPEHARGLGDGHAVHVD